MVNTVTGADIRQAIRDLGLSSSPICVHSSLRSFGEVDGGADTVVDSLLAEGCTMMVPTFSYDFGIMPPPDMRPARNGWQYESDGEEMSAGSARIFTPACNEIHESMGVIPRTLLLRKDRLRGQHPLSSFSALGPLSAELIATQRPLRVFAPFEALIAQGGSIILMGVGLTRLTLLHYAEQRAGRASFRRWANDADGQPMMVEIGGCSDGFGELQDSLLPIIRRVRVGMSDWLVLPAQETAELAASAITAQPEITHCPDAACERCDDAELGGPIV